MAWGIISAISSLFSSGAPRPAIAESPTIPNFEAMSATDILQFIQNMPDQSPARAVAALTKRLYEIAYFDYGISDQDREIARRVLPIAKQAVEKGLEGQPAALKAFHDANSFMDQNISLRGVGSLAFMIGETKPDGTPVVAPDQVIPFISNPRFAPLLPNFLLVLGDENSEAAKVGILRHLIETHSYGARSNAVAIAYSLVTGASHATMSAILPDADLAALLSTPSRYLDARSVLVRQRLLPPTSNAKPIAKRFTPELLVTLIMLSSGLHDDEPMSLAEAPTLAAWFNTLDEEEQSLVRMSLVMLRMRLWFDIIDDTYGHETASQVRERSRAQLKSGRQQGLDGLLSLMDTSERQAINQPNIGVDGVLAIGLSNYWDKKPEADQQAFMDLISGWSDALSFERKRSVDLFRFYLRWFGDGSGPPIEKSDVEQARQGFMAPTSPEPDTMFEDFIGTAAQP